MNTTAINKIIADVQGVLFEAADHLDSLTNKAPRLKNVCKYILEAYSNVPVTDEMVCKLEENLKSSLASNFDIDVNKL